eukprot:4256104-Pleurochrysis_carterae.AAC.2
MTHRTTLVHCAADARTPFQSQTVCAVCKVWVAAAPMPRRAKMMQEQGDASATSVREGSEQNAARPRREEVASTRITDASATQRLPLRHTGCSYMPTCHIAQQTSAGLL